MESEFIWIVTGIIIIAIFLPYLLKFRKSTREGIERSEEAARLGANKPITQYPQIDQLRCIGCGACVAACPEGDVLGLVMGKAQVINGLKCVGHGKCAEACPVEGITIGLGDLSRRPDIPVLNQFNETNIQGLFIAGELGGLALIKNAIQQGKMVIEYIAQSIDRSKRNGIYDVVIIGAGPAGLSAALQALHDQLSCLIIDQQDAGGTILQYPRKKLIMTQPVEIPLYGKLIKPEYAKEELLEIWGEVREKHKLNLHINEQLIDIKKNDGIFEILTSRGRYLSKSTVLALGRRGTPRKLNVPGEDKSKVMYKLIDAETYQNNHILIVGGGDSAIEAALGLARQKGNVVTISYRKGKFFRIKKRNEERLIDWIDQKKINVLFNSNVREIREKSVILEDEDKTVELVNDYAFIFAGGEPPFDLMRKIGIQFGGTEPVPLFLN